MHPQTIRLCLPDLKVGTRHFSLNLSPGLLHTLMHLEFFPISTEASSVQIIRDQFAISHPLFSSAHAFLAKRCCGVRNGFLAAIRESIFITLCMALWTVR